MRLLIISTGPAGTVSLVSDRVFADAGEATRELARLIGEGGVESGAEFHTLDMDAAVPVIILQQPTPVAPAPVADEAVEETLASEVVDETFASEVVEELTSARVTEAEQAEGVDIPVLAEAPALAEDEAEVPAAADVPALEDALVVEGLVAEPADETSAEPATEDAPPQWPWDLPQADEAASDTTPDEAVADATVADSPAADALVPLEGLVEMPPLDDSTVAVPRIEEPAAGEFAFPEPLAAMPDLPPMPDVPGIAFRDPQPLSKEALAEGLTAFAEPSADAASVDAAEAVAAEGVAPAFEEEAPSAPEELAPALDDAPPAEDAPPAFEAMPEAADETSLAPVDAADDALPDAVAEDAGFSGMADVVAALADEIPAEAESVEPDERPDFGLDAIEPEELGIAEPLGVIQPASEDVALDAAVDAAPQPYEPVALNMTDYTCDDCVYVNTCPNQHQKQPAECGSFQWRSV